MVERIVDFVNGILWDYVLIFLLVGVGLYFSFRLRFPQIRKLDKVSNRFLEDYLKKIKRQIKMGCHLFKL